MKQEDYSRLRAKVADLMQSVVDNGAELDKLPTYTDHRLITEARIQQSIAEGIAILASVLIADRGEIVEQGLAQKRSSVKRELGRIAYRLQTQTDASSIARLLTLRDDYKRQLADLDALLAERGEQAP